MHQTASTSEAVVLAKPRWAVEPTFVVPPPPPTHDLTVARWLRLSVMALGACAVALMISWTIGGVLGG